MVSKNTGLRRAKIKITMDQHELKFALHTLGWKLSDLPPLLGVSPKHVSAWITGSSRIPKPFAARIIAALDLDRILPKSHHREQRAHRAGQMDVKNTLDASIKIT